MSDVPKPVEEPAASIEATPVTEPVAEPATEAKPEETTAPAEEVAPAAAETSTAEPAKDVVEPATATEAAVTPANDSTPKKEFTGEGTLGYKAPGGLIKKLVGFQKKYFWFGSEPIHHKNLTNYLRGEKPEVANHNAAWSSHTGKGLLYFSKHSNEKTAPAGIINLADISEITEDGTIDFFFHINGAKYVFQTSTSSDRDSWVAALKTNSAGAKGMAEEVKGSGSYQEHYSSLSKPTVVAPAAAVATTQKDSDVKKEEKAEAKEDKKEEKAAAKEDKEAAKARKSRSGSRKRNSVFGFSLGPKREGHAESKGDKKTEVAPTETATTEATPAPLDATTAAAAAAAAPVDESADTDAATPAETTKPAATSKRNSIFGTISSRFGPKKSTDRKSSSDAGPAVPAKDAAAVEPVSDAAPVIPAPEASESLTAAVESPATVPVTEITNGVTKAEESKPEDKPETKTEPAQKRKSSLTFGFAKLRDTVRGRSSKAAEKAPEKPAEKAGEKPEDKASEQVAETSADTSKPAETAPTEPIVSEPVTAAHQPNTEVTATA